jgi:Zn-dependent peptidase ImmA (M78 family)
VTERIDINPSLIRWAVKRSGRASEGLADKFPKLRSWQTEKRARLTFVELERLSNETHTPLGFFFLDSPPPEDVPIPDFRTVKDKSVARMSPDLVDTLHSMQLRQQWCHDFALEEGWDRLPFVGSTNPGVNVAGVAQDILNKLGLTQGWASGLRTPDEAVSLVREKIEDLGILIVINGCVGNNTSRVLSVDEFRGFVISDTHAPLIFINGHDAKAAQVFTMFHELVHLWINRSALLDLKELADPLDATEKYCNKVAAEALIPERELQTIWYSYEKSESPFHTLAKRFKVSPIVVGLRLQELELISRKSFFDFYAEYQAGIDQIKKRDSGGNFYSNQNFRIGKRFMRIVSRAAYEGRITFTEAYKLTGLNNATFDEYLRRIGDNL